MASKKTKENEVLDLNMQKAGLDLVAKIYASGIAVPKNTEEAYSACARGVPTAGDVETLGGFYSSLLDG